MGILSVHNSANSGFVNPDLPVESWCSAGDNLLMLLGLPLDSRVLILGNSLRHWRDFFRNSHVLDVFADSLSQGGGYELILYHASCAVNLVQLRTQLEILRKLSGANGQLMMFAPNFYSISRLKKLRGRVGRSQGGQIRCGRTGYRRALMAAGFSRGREYLTLSGLEAAKEIVVPGSRFFELPYHWHPFLHFAQRLRFYPVVADGYLYIQGPVPPEQGALLRVIAEQLNSVDNAWKGGCTLERFDLRLRGALVLFVSDQRNLSSVIVRVVSDPRVRMIVRRNQEILQALRAMVEMPDSVRELLPCPMGDFIFAERAVYVETLKEGILAWKRNNGSLCKRIYQDATRFIWRLQMASRRPSQYAAGSLEALFAADLHQLEECPVVTARLRADVSRAVVGIRTSIEGWSGWLVASHGDYGYGNLLVDPDRGSLTGVIDWDTGKLADLPGLDLLNLEVQRVRIEQGVGVYAAFVAVCTRVLARGGLDDAGAYAAEFGIDGSRLSALLYACLLRYLCRAAQYPEVFLAEQEDYQRSLDYLNLMVPL